MKTKQSTLGFSSLAIMLVAAFSLMSARAALLPAPTLSGPANGATGVSTSPTFSGSVEICFQDSRTGMGVVPDTVLVDDTNVAKQVDASGRLRLDVLPGEHGILVSAKGYQDLGTRQTVLAGNTSKSIILLDPTTPLAEPIVEALGAIGEVSRAAIRGYVVDDETGQPITGATLAVVGTNATVTDAHGFFTLTVPVGAGTTMPEDNAGRFFVKKNMVVTKVGYGTVEEQNIVLIGGETYRFQFRLVPGGVTRVINEQDHRGNMQATTFDGRPPVADSAAATPPASLDTPLPPPQPASSTPCTIRVGRTGCSSSPGACSTVVSMSMETYVKHVLPAEWYASWNAESLKAGAVAIRSYGGYYVNNPISPSSSPAYDICDSTDCQVYGNTTATSTDSAVDATAGIYLVDGSGNIAKTMYSQENNDLANRDGCGNCYTKNKPGDGICLYDSVCCGSTQAGHGEGMCQWGSQRWALQGQTYTWILSHYYNAYSYTLQTLTCGTVTPSMSLTYNGTAIPNGDSSPGAAKGTDFGTIVYGFQSSPRTFTINNSGTGALNLTGVPRVQFGGNNPSDFYMTAQPATPVGANGGSTTFQLVFEPTVNTGLRSATVTIANNDPNKNPYTFTVQGTAQIQQRIDPSLKYSGATINNGDQSPTVSKGTDFGSVNVGSPSSTHSFQFYNYGNINMTLTGSMVQLSGANSGDFSIVSMPSSPIAPNQYSTIGIRFQPTGSGLRTASMLIYFDATYGLGATSPYTVALQGTGTANNISVTVQPNPSGHSFTVDGTTYTTAQTFIWVSGSSHPIGSTSPQSGGTGIQYVWSSWSDGGAISHTVVPTSGTTYTANFTTQYYLTMNAGTGGGVSPGSGWYNSGTGVGISATANGGYSFSSWTGSGSGSYSGNSSSTSVTMNGPITEAASFAPNPISVTVQPSPSGRSFTVDGTTYTTSQTFNWVSGSSHAIATTSPQSGGTGIQYVWSSWSDGGAISHTVAPTSGTTYTANFTTQYYLTMNAGTGGGVSPGSGWYNSGTGVGISATASGGYAFSSWTGSGSGSYSGNSSSTSVTMNGPITEAASFAPNPISVTVQPSPSGRSFTVDGTTYTTSQTFNWVSGSSHAIATTSPQSGGTGIQYVWSSWSDGGAISHTVAPTSGTTYTANFTTQYYLTMNAGTGGGVSPGSGWYNSGTGVGISATASGGYSFSSWTGSGSGSYSGSSSSTSVTMNGPITETASFSATSQQPNQLSGMSMSNGVFRFLLNGPVGSNYVIQVSSNLVNWSALLTNVIPAGGSRVIDLPIQTNQPKQFYRAVLLLSGPLVLQPGPVDSQDIWTTSVFYFACASQGIGGGLDDYRLRIGGWGDIYYSLIQFNLTGLPTNAASAVLYLYCENLSGGGTPLYLDRVTSSWNWKTSGTGCDRLRLWWADKPSTVQWVGSQLPTPSLGQWYAVDITTLYNAWQNGTYPNYGLQFRPVLNSNNNFDEFYSADYTGDPTLRPKLIITK